MKALETSQFLSGSPPPATAVEESLPMTLEAFLPVTKTVTVYRSRTDIRTLKCGDTLTGEDVVEGFACQVEELFE